MKHGQAQHGAEQRPGHPAQAGPRGEHGDCAGHGQGDGQPAQAGDVVADVLGQQDVGGPAARGGEGEREAWQASSAAPGLSQQHDTDGSRGGPAPASAPGTVQGHRQRPEELQRAGGAERDARDREHEQQHQSGRHRTQHAAGQQIPAGEVPQARPDQGQQDYACPGQPQSGYAQRAELAEQVHRQGQPELDTRHGHHCHQRPAPGIAHAAGQRAACARRAHDAH
jgi:hypothetical protein